MPFLTVLKTKTMEFKDMEPHCTSVYNSQSTSYLHETLLLIKNLNDFYTSIVLVPRELETALFEVEYSGIRRF